MLKRIENQHELNFQAKIQFKTLSKFLAETANYAGAEAGNHRASPALGAAPGAMLPFSARPPRALNL